MIEKVFLIILSLLSFLIFFTLRNKRIKKEKIEKDFFETCYVLNNALKEGIALETSFRKISSNFKSFDEYVSFVSINSMSKAIKNSCILILEALKFGLQMSKVFSEVEYFKKVYEEEVKFKNELKSLARWMTAFSFFVFPLSFFFISIFVQTDVLVLFLVSSISSINLLFFSSLITRTTFEKIFLIPLLILINYFVFFSSLAFFENIFEIPELSFNIK
ncbi:MAG: hypothetical protein RMJ17_01435 [Candidatus Aenigmarchaeota archaeon]|nr:hypothetical protein [Candidatus Aenigmarchaeota archaeon]MDW8149243.1 hypothetical protein [Candidatus Aenigmarchaeota archaeon]